MVASSSKKDKAWINWVEALTLCSAAAGLAALSIAPPQSGETGAPLFVATQEKNAERSIATSTDSSLSSPHEVRLSCENPPKELAHPEVFSIRGNCLPDAVAWVTPGATPRKLEILRTADGFSTPYFKANTPSSTLEIQIGTKTVKITLKSLI